MAADIEKEALEPLITMAIDLIFQFIDTAADPRVATILGVGADVIKGMSREQLVEMISGDYSVKVSGITGQIMKSEMLQNLVQFMNLIGQNPQAWLPYINEDALLRRILEAFRPHIHDIEEIIADPATADAKKVAAASQEILPEILRQIQSSSPATAAPTSPPPLDPNNILDHTMDLQRMTHDQEMARQEQASQMQQQQHEMALAQMQQQQQQSTPYAPQGGNPQGGGR
jgi:hypothetical protein